MGLVVYRTPRFVKYLENLAKADKKGALAAERAERIISHLVRDGWDAVEMRHKLTKKGELRVRNCFKFDLGSGYRLIGLRRENEFYLLIAGSHDECDRWLNRQRGTTVTVEPESFVMVEEGEADLPGEWEPPASFEENDEYEEQLAAKLDDTTLRLVFRGLCSR